MNDTINRELTQAEVKKALANLPSNYVIETQKLLKEWLEEEKIEKSYSDRYVQKVKAGEADNVHILLALVEVGTANGNTSKLFAFRNKKNSQAKK